MDGLVQVWRGRLALALLLVCAGVLLTVTAARVAPDPSEEYSKRADSEFRAGQITAAVLDYNRAVALSPKESRPYVGLAVLYEGVNRPDLAIEALEQLRAANPEAPHLWCRLAEAHLGVEDVPQARRLGAEAVAREPGCARAFSAYGIALARSRFWISARAALQRAQELAPDDPGIGETLVDVTVQQGAFREAAELGERLLATNPGSPKLHYHLGLAYTRLIPAPGAAENAIRHFSRTAELAPTWFEPHAELGRLYLGLGRREAAAAAFEQAWRINPGVPGVAFNLALLWRERGDPRAEKLQRRVSQLSRAAGGLDVLRARYYQQPGDMANTLVTAETEAGGGQFGAALYRLRKSLASDPAELRLLKAYRRIDLQARTGYPDYLRPGPDRTAL